MISKTFLFICACALLTAMSAGAQHSADTNNNWVIEKAEVARVTSLYRARNGYHCDPRQRDGYARGFGNRSCAPHDSDLNYNWRIDFTELVRLNQLYGPNGYTNCTETVDGYIANGDSCCYDLGVPSIISTIQPTAWPIWVLRDRDLMYAYVQGMKYEVYNITNPSSPSLICTLEGFNGEVRIHNKHVWQFHENQMNVYTLAGKMVGSMPIKTSIPYHPLFVVFDKHRAYAAKDGVLNVIDISNPSAPTIVSTSSVSVGRIYVTDGKLVVHFVTIQDGDFVSGVEIYVIDNDMLTSVGTISDIRGDVSVKDNIVVHRKEFQNVDYLVEAWDISSPASPQYLGKVNPADPPRWVVHDCGYLYVGFDRSLNIYDLQTWQEVFTMSTPHGPRPLFVKDACLFNMNDGAIDIFDLE